MSASAYGISGLDLESTGEDRVAKLSGLLCPGLYYADQVGVQCGEGSCRL